jgi:hypothetical protein
MEEGNAYIKRFFSSTNCSFSNNVGNIPWIFIFSVFGADKRQKYIIIELFLSLGCYLPAMTASVPVFEDWYFALITPK